MTIAGQEYDLPEPFHVLATQNPIEQEGTYPLPEAQLDRFLVQIDVGMPNRENERAILEATTGVDNAVAAQVLSGDELIAAQNIVRQMALWVMRWSKRFWIWCVPRDQTSQAQAIP